MDQEDIVTLLSVFLYTGNFEVEGNCKILKEELSIKKN